MGAIVEAASFFAGIPAGRVTCCFSFEPVVALRLPTANGCDHFVIKKTMLFASWETGGCNQKLFGSSR
jgi:hypothetical protein